MKNLISPFIQATAIFALLIISSCGSGVGTGIANCNSEDLSNRADAFLNAAAVYSQEPSTENCNAYKKSLEDYIEIIEECSFARTVSKKEIEDTIAELGC